MTRPLRIEYPGAYYHITSRGNERKNIFKDKKDRDKFLSYLKSAHLRYKSAIHAFCLMNNHYHLFLETPKGNLSQIMHLDENGLTSASAGQAHCMLKKTVLFAKLRLWI